MGPDDVTVRDNPDKSRFEIRVEGELAGFIDYKRSPTKVAMIHTETLPAFGGRGLASLLVTGALDLVKAEGLAVIPYCPFVRKVIADAPEDYLALVPEDRRGECGLPHT